jgi:UDPglucose--hexose-1-phosphate uridylyltransferase
MIQGFHVHDVFVETPDHCPAIARMSDAHVADIQRMYKMRYYELSLDPRIPHVTIFKHHGVYAGTSLKHPHTQLIAAPVISCQVRQRFSEALRHHDDFGICVFCQKIEEELELNERVVLVTEHFVATWRALATPVPQEILDLGRTLRTVLAKIYYGLENPDFNLTVRTAPAECLGVKYL